MTVVDTTTGKVEGRAQDGLHVFRGIPVAAAPAGEHRLRAPRPVDPWTGVRRAHDYGPWAPQNAPATHVEDAPYDEERQLWQADALR